MGVFKIFEILLNLKVCKSNKDEKLIEMFDASTRALNIHNVFNPSFYCDDDVKVFAFRAIPNGNDTVTSFVSIEDKTGHCVKNISIEYYEQLNGVRLIDPKVTRITGELYVTFNSGAGWKDEWNQIFIMKIYPNIESPKTVHYKNRKKQERNWGFFSEQGEIYALYSVSPLKILRLKHTDPKSWEMEDYYCEEKQNSNPLNDLTIGTQLFKSNGKYHFIVHRKIHLLTKKVYFGRLCTLDFDKKRTTLGRYWLVHSWASLLGSSVIHNTNLLSCTYFSGLQASTASISLGYGVNDVRSSFSTHQLKNL